MKSTLRVVLFLRVCARQIFLPKMCLHGFLKEHIMQLSTVLPEPFIFFSHTHTNSLTRVNGRVCINVLGAPDSVKARKCLEFCVSNFFLFFVFFRYRRVDMSPTSRCMSSECTMNNLTNNLFNFYPPTFFFFLLVCQTASSFQVRRMNKCVSMSVVLFSTIFCSRHPAAVLQELQLENVS